MITIQMDINNFIELNEDYKIYSIPNYVDRHNLRKMIPSTYKCLTEYIPSGKKTKCDICNEWNNVENSINACCGDDPHSGCTSSYRKIECKNKYISKHDIDDDDGYIYFHYDDPDDVKPIWKPSGNVLIIKKNIPYKYMNNSKVSYKRHYTN